MFSKRLAHYAESRGIVLPAWEDARVSEGIAGVLRVAIDVPVWVRSDVEARVGPANLIIDRLNASPLTVRIRPGDGGRQAVDAFARGARLPLRCALELLLDGLAYLLVPGRDGFQLVDARPEGPADEPELRLLARFSAGRAPGSEAETILRLVAARLVTTRVAGWATRIRGRDESFLLPYQRYVEALRDQLTAKPRPVPYRVVSRQPLCLAISDDVAEEIDAWPLAYTLPRAQVSLVRSSRRLIRVEIASISDDRTQLTLCEDDAKDDPVLEDGLAQLADAAGPLRRMVEALDALAVGHHEAHLRLLDALLRPAELPRLTVPAQPFPRLGERGTDNDAQHRAVAMALACPDLCVIDGPPGTGKTTVICEIIRNLIARGERVLLVAPTHVALDHVLKRMGDEPGVYALRLGWPEMVDPGAHDFLVEHRGDSLRKRLVDGLEDALSGVNMADPVAMVQKTLLGEIRDDEQIGDTLLFNANLVCATPLGIAMTPAFREPEPVFDVLIMDEASKATVTEMLVPATRTARWILVGDHLQLSPYADARDLQAIVTQRAQRLYDDVDPEWVGEVAWRVRQLFDQRGHPEEGVRRRLRRFLAEAAFQEETDEVIALLAEVEDTAWRQFARDELPCPEGVRDPEQFQLRARLIAEILEMRDVAMVSAFALARDALSQSPRRVSLDCQHRMHPQLAEFSYRWVYAPHQLGYHSSTESATRGLPVDSLESPSIWIDTAWADAAERNEHPRDGTWQSGRYENPLEVDVAVEVVEACIRWAATAYRETKKQPDAAFEIGVVTFYLTQAHRLREALRAVFEPGSSRWRGRAKERTADGRPIDIHVSIVDRFQGQEKDIIVLSATRSNPAYRRGHVNNLNRLNVAVTRAQHKRIIIGDSSTLARRGKQERPDGDLLRELLASCDHKHAWGNRLGRGGPGST
jgi:hypothetical protein